MTGSVENQPLIVDAQPFGHPHRRENIASCVMDTFDSGLPIKFVHRLIMQPCGIAFQLL